MDSQNKFKTIVISNSMYNFIMKCCREENLSFNDFTKRALNSYLFTNHSKEQEKKIKIFIEFIGKIESIEVPKIKFNKLEIGFFSRIPSMLKKEIDLEKITKMFNYSFKWAFSTEQFKKIIKGVLK